VSRFDANALCSKVRSEAIASEPSFAAGLAIMTDNLFDDIPTAIGEEAIAELLVAENLRIERIISMGQASPPGFWYDQPLAEWLLLLAGSAGLRIEGESEVRLLRRGDYLHIPAHRRHRVEWTEAGSPTIWLAIHHG
jgi:cupin 2 domain-containing protein